MKMSIWKYPLAIADTQIVIMPEGAEILSAQLQGPQICLWALVKPDAPEQPRQIEVLGTGNPASDVGRRFIATVQMKSLVWHVFELIL